MASELDEFLAEMVPTQTAAELAMHEGNVEPRLKIWSQNDPVTLFGALVPLRTGWPEVSQTFRWVASQFADPSDYRFEVVAAGVGGDLAYTIGFEHNTVHFRGEAATYTLRVTHIYRREDGQWRIVHRHGDRVPDDHERATP
ncbi:YybH family protein [Actinokineospora sp. HUAS TT18]|uniref:YybH family protein n=1 Tax=Actinokineospora sp. HUAS TT18 TaxID=3447451 RepID=UPI003F528179